MSEQGRFSVQIMGVIAEFERERISERVRDARQALVRSGRWPAGRALYGYHWDKTERHFEVVEAEAAIVRLAFDLYVNKGIGQVPVMHVLNHDGYRIRTGSPWRARGVWHILTDHRYTGEDGHFQCPPIISADLFDAAQKKRKEARRIWRDPGQHLLQGHVVCGGYIKGVGVEFASHPLQPGIVLLVVWV